MSVAVLQFPGSNCDLDALNAFRVVIGRPSRLIWHKETCLGDATAVVVPGGFSYGDYLRCGAIARFSPVMRAVADFAGRGGPVLGICNGFQILCEAGLLPGALIRNRGLTFRCETVNLRVEDNVAGLLPGQVGRILRVPIAHGEGNYRIDEDGLRALVQNRQIVLRYCDSLGATTDSANPNGSISNIAAICNRAGNVIGMMPHPERACEPLHPSLDGLEVLRAFLANADPRSAAPAVVSA